MGQDNHCTLDQIFKYMYGSSNMAQLTRHFTRDEYACECGCGAKNIDIKLAYILELIRCIANKPITIVSGCRCPIHNKNVGGAENSCHITVPEQDGWAVDFTSDHSTMATLSYLLCHWSGGFHYYTDDNFIHIDLGPMRRW